MPRQPLHGRALVSLSMLVGFLIVSISGLVLFFSPPGRMAQEIGWDFWGLTKGNWRDFHILFGFIFTFGGLIHLILNIKPLAGYIRKRKTEQPDQKPRVHWRLEGALILLVTILLCLSAVNNTWPARYLNDLRQNISQYWQSGSDRPGGGNGPGFGARH